MLVEYVKNELLRQKIICREQEELLIYALEEVVHQIQIIFSILAIGLIFKRPLETIAFIFVFPISRKYSGGVHAISKKRCYIITIITYCMALLISTMENSFFMMCLAIISAGVIFQNTPLEHPNNKLNLRQQSRYRKYGQQLIVCITSISIIFQTFFESSVLTMIFTIIVINGGSTMLFKTKNHHCKKVIYYRVLHLLTAFVLYIGTSSLNGTCKGWNYQPQISQGLRKYVD